mmetsp:Transcript_6510/g.23083  ORF Transcript_6510/g.23083 Transcript_6510/m.23083 type:complete len:152 (+) Transcript_6510:1498-1953(+)
MQRPKSRLRPRVAARSRTPARRTGDPYITPRAPMSANLLFHAMSTETRASSTVSCGWLATSGAFEDEARVELRDYKVLVGEKGVARVLWPDADVCCECRKGVCVCRLRVGNDLAKRRCGFAPEAVCRGDGDERGDVDCKFFAILNGISERK